MKLVWFALAALGVGFALSGAACSDNYCPNGATSGGSGGSAGAGGSSCTGESANAGSGGSTTCAALTATKSCLTAFCKSDGAGTPFCNCFLKGYDLSAPNTDTNGNETGCACVAFNDAKLCATFADPDAGDTVDCSVVDGQVASMCVGVN